MIVTMLITLVSFSPLSIGRVNEFGIYEAIFEPEPDRDRHNTSTGEYFLILL